MSERIAIRDKKAELPGRMPGRKTRVTICKEEYRMYLTLKIGEELSELIDVIKGGDKSSVLYELADLYEITIGLGQDWDDFCYRYPQVQDGIDMYGITLYDIIDTADGKRLSHGGFDKCILLDLDTVRT